MSTGNTLIIRQLGLQDYQASWAKMRDFTEQRDSSTVDEIWLLQHPPVFTLGRNASQDHILKTGNIPIVQIDRGGQVTYHGPGQLVAYLLLDIKRRSLGVRALVTAIEQGIIDTLALYKLQASAKKEAPGVYVDGAKIAALGLRIKRGCSFHGLSLNISMDLAPFAYINPCGNKDLRVTQLANHVENFDYDVISRQLIENLNTHLGYDKLYHNP